MKFEIWQNEDKTETVMLLVGASPEEHARLTTDVDGRPMQHVVTIDADTWEQAKIEYSKILFDTPV